MPPVTEPGRPRGLLLDIGGVVHASGIDLVTRLAEAEPAMRPVLERIGGVGSERDELWQQMLRRQVTERQYWAQRAAELGAAVGQTWDTKALIQKETHRDDPDLIAKKARIDTHHVELLSYFLTKMRDTPDGDGSLLDHSLIMYGGGMGNGNLHRHEHLPCLLAGNLGGQFKTGYHVAYPENTHMTNLLLTILDKAGVHIDSLGDSTGPLATLSEPRA